MSLAAKNSIIIILILIMTITPFVIKPNAEFGGADGAAGDIIKKINPEYQSWFSHIWEPPSGEIESLLFALQAAIGAGFLGYYIGSKRTKAKYQTEMEKDNR
ncbi:energy-coupling factor ABC transporter substrate-binding protein [Selenihalanaerobacter shriftii]|uniref:Cobalt transport protein CbiN n=1 Tax=Selenihalanaerobacter shriftii TaxID=142842 RepID=A0A1T4K2E1_9FIRM|nr:energy-coupling factor ABC transporter substrate-binding protein [Selenihalanaerobacter shriftii]SJZ36626.1 cobalt/nickel transport protein [Selenihalanaerobacter shriftii]